MLHSYIAPFFYCQALNRALYRYMEKRTIALARFRSITLRGSSTNAPSFWGLLEKCNRNRSTLKNRFRPNAHEEGPGQLGRENVSQEPQRLARVPENPKRDPQAHRIRPIAIR